jgi:hypothetical protein
MRVAPAMVETTRSTTMTRTRRKPPSSFATGSLASLLPFTCCLSVFMAVSLPCVDYGHGATMLEL